jgi:hypothetical protein
MSSGHSSHHLDTVAAIDGSDDQAHAGMGGC